MLRSFPDFFSFHAAPRCSAAAPTVLSPQASVHASQRSALGRAGLFDVRHDQAPLSTPAPAAPGDETILRPCVQHSLSGTLGPPDNSKVATLCILLFLLKCTYSTYRTQHVGSTIFPLHCSNIISGVCGSSSSQSTINTVSFHICVLYRIKNESTNACGNATSIFVYPARHLLGNLFHPSQVAMGSVPAEC